MLVLLRFFLLLILSLNSLVVSAKPIQKVQIHFYYADWCPYCKQMIPRLKSAQEKDSNLQIEWVDLSTNEGKLFAARHKIKKQGIPYMQFYSQNEEFLFDIEGAIPEPVLVLAIADARAKQAIKPSKKK